MAIEVMFADLTAAINRLADVWEGTRSLFNASSDADDKPAAKTTRKKRAAKKDAPTNDTAAVTKTVDRSTVRSFLGKVLKPKAAKPVFEQFGIDKFSDLPDDQLQEFYEAAQAAEAAKTAAKDG